MTLTGRLHSFAFDESEKQNNLCKCGHAERKHGTKGKLCASCLCREFTVESPIGDGK